MKKKTFSLSILFPVCSGSLFLENLVITAASCVNGASLQNIKVSLGCKSVPLNQLSCLFERAEVSAKKVSPTYGQIRCVISMTTEEKLDSFHLAHFPVAASPAGTWQFSS